MIHSSLYPPVEYPSPTKDIMKVIEESEAKSVPPFKYKEAEILQELHDYLASTYKSHYVGDDNIQSNDLIFAAGRGDGFCVGNIIKYASRYGKKKGNERPDILKILHYAMLLLFLHDKKELTKRIDGS